MMYSAGATSIWQLANFTWFCELRTSNMYAGIAHVAKNAFEMWWIENLAVQLCEALVFAIMLVVLSWKAWMRRSSVAAQSKVNVEEIDALSNVLKRRAHMSRLEADKAMRHRLAACAQSAQWDEMVKTMEKLEKRSRNGARVSDYHMVIRHLSGECRNPAASHKWLRRCVDRGLRPTIELFNMVLNSYVKGGAYEQAKQVENEILDAGLAFDGSTYSIMMNASRRAGHDSTVQNWMKKMLAQGLQPDIKHFGVVLPACAAAGLVDDLDLWFKAAQDLGVKLDCQAFETVVWLLVKNEDPSNALKYLTIMLGQQLHPKSGCYVKLLNAILDKRDVELAGALIDILRGLDTYHNGLFDGALNRCTMMAAQDGHKSQAVTWAIELIECKFKLQPPTFQALLKAGLDLPQSDKGAIVKKGKQDVIAANTVQQDSIASNREQLC